MPDRNDEHDDGASDEKFDLAGAFEEIVAYQRELEEKAKRIVETVRSMVNYGGEDLAPGFVGLFAELHGAWYDSIERQLAAEGFTVLGAYRDVTPRGEKPPERQSFYRFARSGDGTIVASWFWFPVEKDPYGCVVLHTWSTTGALAVTGSGILDAGLPAPPDQLVLRFPADTSVKRLLAAHREQAAKLPTPLATPADMAEIIALRNADYEKTRVYRTEVGVDLFEPVLRKTWGDQYEEEGAPFVEVIKEHPEWWTGEEPADEDAPDDEPIDPSSPPRFMFLMSRNDDEEGRGHITTMGLAMHGLPEMQMKELAANHCRAARFLMGAVAKRLVQHVADLPASDEPIERRLSGIELELQPDDPWVEPTQPPPTPPPGEAVTVALRMEQFGGSAPPPSVGGLLASLLGGNQSESAPELLRVVPPSSWTRSADEWLIDVNRRLSKLEIPDAAPLSAYNAVMTAASQQARRSIPELRHRLKSGLPQGHHVVIKTGLATQSGGTEFVWVQVDSYADGAFVGTLSVEPDDLPGLAMGQEMRIEDADVFDRGIYSETDGMIEAPLTDNVALDFGVDLPSQ